MPPDKPKRQLSRVILGLLSAFLALAGIGMLVGFRLADPFIDEAGLLHEPFYLIPLGYLALIGGIVGLALTVFSPRWKR